MKRLLVLAASCLSIGAGLCFAEDASLKSGDLVGIVGDSITEQKMYSVLMEDYLLMCKPVADLRTVQFGWSGETASGFANRMQNDMLRFHTTAATTCFGMNDGGYSPMDPGKAARYKTSQKSVIDQMKKGGVRFIVLGSPGCVDLNTFHNKNRADAEMYNKTLGAERDIDKQLAADEGVVFADVFQPMHDVMEKAEEKYGKDYNVAGGDGVHPGWNGHLIMAYALLKGLGASGDIGTITYDLADNKATATDGHKVLSAGDGSVEIESTRYPFCFPASGPANSPASIRGILEFFPAFNQDLNRFLLVVKNAPGKQVKVTWGTESKSFSGDELAKGINLAAEFLDNPFVAQFAKVQQAVAQQQGFETPLVKELIHFSPRYLELDPDLKEPMDKALGKGIAKAADLQKVALDLVVPVKYTIKIEAEK